MDMNMEIGVLLAYGFALLALYVVGYLFLVPLKFLLKLIVNSILGGVVILLINLVGGIWGFHLALNVFSAIIVGVLGLPGVALLAILTCFVF